MKPESVLFVCHGNICRSPIAEFVMKDLLAKRGIGGVRVESAAASSEEIGNPVYPPARAVLAAHGISCGGKRSRRITRADFESFDLILVMDKSNVRNIAGFCGGQFGPGKISPPAQKLFFRFLRPARKTSGAQRRRPVLPAREEGQNTDAPRRPGCADKARCPFRETGG